MKKNDKIELNIEALTGEGVGIGRVSGLAVFVQGTAVGDKVLAHVIKVKKNYAVAKLLEVIVPSADRTETSCSAFKSCGGCAFRHISYEKELEVKQRAVEDAMRRIGGVDKSPLEIIPSPEIMGYRNKAQYPITVKDGKISYGFFARHSHRVICHDDCKLQPEIFEEIMKTVCLWAERNKITAYDEQSHKGLLRHIIIRRAEQTGEIMVVPVINGEDLPQSDELICDLKAFIPNNFSCLSVNINKEETNVILGEETKTLYGKGYITDIICGVKLNISPTAFYQVNRSAAEILYKKASEFISNEDKVILDLYCGIGSIGLSVLNLCGKDKKLYGVEINPFAIENAKENAKISGLSDAEFFAADATKAVKMLESKNISPDIVILDPPRKGCDGELINTVANGFKPKKIVYISCDPATLARDTKLLNKLGYSLISYQPVDLFPRTGHVETAALFLRDINS